MVVVAAWRAPERHPGLAAVLRARDGDVGHVDDVGIARIDHDLLEVPAATPECLVSRELGPGGTRIIGAKHAALSRRCRLSAGTSAGTRWRLRGSASGRRWTGSQAV